MFTPGTKIPGFYIGGGYNRGLPCILHPRGCHTPGRKRALFYNTAVYDVVLLLWILLCAQRAKQHPPSPAYRPAQPPSLGIWLSYYRGSLV